ncbi:MAG: hypothetical protein AB7I37_15675 [Pirellulales bacterium]
MKTTAILAGLIVALALAVTYAQSEPDPEGEAVADDTVLLWTYRGNYKMTPPPTLYSDAIRIKIQSVELLEGPSGIATTKITYSPWYGKINSESLKFKKDHETQAISFLLDGDHTAKVKEGDILRTCFYPN